MMRVETMKKINKSIVIIVCAFLVVLAAAGCRKKQQTPPSALPENVESSPLNPLVLPGNEEGLVTFLSGEAEILSGGSWQFLEIGDLISKEDSIRVAEDSFCEIQFGDFAVLRIEEDTFVAIETIAEAGDASNITLNLRSGSLLCKVKRIGSNDAFTVLSPSMALGVRGTEFYISTSDGRDFRTAVREGRLQVFPAAMDQNTIAALPDESKAKVLMVNYILMQSTILQPEEELTLTEREAAAVAAGNTIIEELLAAGEDAPEAEWEAVVTDLSEVQGSIPDPLPITEESVQFLKKIDDIHEVDLTAEEGELVKVAVTSVPTQATVLVDERKEGITPYAGIYPADTEVNFELRKPGFITRRIPVSLEKRGDMILKVTLEEDEDWIPPENQTAEEPVSVPGKVRVEVTITPASAVIRKDGKTVGTGKYADQFEPGERVTLRLSDPLYEEEEVEIQVGEDGEQEYSYSLKLRALVRTIPVADSRIAALFSTGTGLAAADASGNLVFLDREGMGMSSLQVGIVPERETRPVVDEGRIYLLGDGRLVVIDVRQEQIIFDVEVSASDRFAFGRRVAVLDGKGVFPGDNSISMFSTDSGEVLDEIQIAQGMEMSPLSGGDSLITVNRKGQILVLDEDGEYEDIIPTTVLTDGNVFAAQRDEIIYFIDDRGNAVSLDSSSGTILWESSAVAAQVGGDVAKHYSLEPGINGLYVYDGDKVLFLSKAGGALLFETGGGIGTAPLADRDLLYLCSRDGELLVLDSVAGKQRNRVSLGSPATAPPVLQDRFLLIGLDNGSVAVVNPAALR
jgi:outer membrane protein assembly factor BamB